MKKLMNSFLPVITVSAIILTFAARAEVFEYRKALAVTDCFIPSGSDLAVKNLLCFASPNTILPGDPCTEVAVNFPVFDLDASHFFTDPIVEERCDGGAYFCCFKLKVGVACSNPIINAGDGVSRRYLVSEFFCRTTIP